MWRPRPAASRRPTWRWWPRRGPPQPSSAACRRRSPRSWSSRRSPARPRCSPPATATHSPSAARSPRRAAPPPGDSPHPSGPGCARRSYRRWTRPWAHDGRGPDPGRHAWQGGRLRPGAGDRLLDHHHRLHPEPVVPVVRGARAVREMVLGAAGLPARRLRAVPADLPPVHPPVRPAGSQPDRRDPRAVHRRQPGRQRDPRLAAVSPAAQSFSRAGLVLAMVLALDQLSKRIVIATVDRGDSNSVFPGIDIVRVSNKGVAFGAFSGRPIVIVIVIAALAGLIVWFTLHVRRPYIWLPTGLLLGGALGNIIDRLRDGAVTDFIKFPLWPAFNFADVAITVGVLALIYVLEQRDAADDAA